MSSSSLDAQIGRALAQQLPPWSCRIVVWGDASQDFVEGLKSETRRVTTAAQPFDSEVGSCDAVCGLYNSIAELRNAAAQTSSLLHDNGLWVFAHVRAGDNRESLSQSEAEGCLASLNLVSYAQVSLAFESSVECGGQDCGYIITAVKNTYNPIMHARVLFDTGHLMWSYEALARVPRNLLAKPEDKAAIQAEMQLCLLSWDRVGDPKDRLARFYLSQAHFYEAVYEAPSYQLPYAIQSEFWRDLGDPNLASRIVESYNHWFGQAGPEARVSVEFPHATAPSCFSGRSLRVLFLIHPRPHYGLDVLYDGLCAVLGEEMVTDYPFKPWLHGVPPAEHVHYPCTFQHAGSPMTFAELIENLHSNHYDIVLLGSAHDQFSSDQRTEITNAIGSTPVFVVDAEDDPNDNYAAAMNAFGIPAKAYFKREMLHCVDYPNPTFPLPFAYPDSHVPESVPDARSSALFWAGHRKFGMRRAYLEHLERRLELNLEKNYAQAKYREALLQSQIGLNFFGLGYDTVRYWELPAHGCMLLSERLPLRIQHNFVDGESAVFFETARDLDEKIDFYLSHPDETLRIARNGRNHLKQFHTGSARARQLLGWIETFLKMG